MTRYAIITALLAAALTCPAAAKNVDLLTLPTRDTVQLTIYNSEDITLVKETRSITLKKGMNKLQFSWANTLIDPTSVEFRPLERTDQIELVDTVFPGQKPQHLIWNVQSEFEGQARVEVSYFTSGLTWSMDYVATADPAEETLAFRGYVRVFNNSGEEYENAQVRLIVGTINLVEKIADLARRQGIPVPPRAAPAFRRMRAKSSHRAFAQAEMAADEVLSKGKQIVKEGLSEYFMFTVEGTETIPNGWSKRMRAVEADDVKFDIVYRQRDYMYGPRPVRFFIWRNDDEHSLGECPLPDGRVRLFRDNGQSGLSFLASQQIRYVPIKAKIEINLGPDDLVVYETRKDQTQRMGFKFEKHGHQLEVVGWDEQTDWLDTIRNFRDKPITLELRRRWDGDIEYDSEVETSQFDYRTVETKFTVDELDEVQYPCTILRHIGRNQQESRVVLRRQ